MESLVDKNPNQLDARNLDTTPLKDFGVMGISGLELDLNEWRLEITGLVRRPLKLDYSQVPAMPSIERHVVQICPGFFANYGLWKGLSMKALLERAQIQGNATRILFKGPKGAYEKVENFPLDDVISNRVFLAYGVNGEPLPGKHGSPLRVVAEGRYGYEWVKYVYEMSVA